MPVSERPGIYSSYEVNTDLSSASGGMTVGIAADAGSVTKCAVVTSYADAVKAFGSSCSMTALIKAALANGAAAVSAYPVTDGGYAAAFAALVKDDSVNIILCNECSADARTALKQALDNASEQHKYKLGVCELGGTAAELAAAAKQLNCERMVLCGNTRADGKAGEIAAAFAGLIASGSSPTRSFNAAVIEGIGSLEHEFSDSDTDLLIRSGVTPIESEAGEISVVRAVTTRTSTNGSADSSWRDIGVILTVNNVLPDVRNALRRRFMQSKNNAQTRSAIRTQVIVELEKKKKLGIIAGYSDVAAAADSSDPELCRVSFGFSVARGLNTIELVVGVNV